MHENKQVPIWVYLKIRHPQIYWFPTIFATESQIKSLFGGNARFSNTPIWLNTNKTPTCIFDLLGGLLVSMMGPYRLQRGQFKKTLKNRLTLCIFFALNTWFSINHVLLGGSNPAKNILVSQFGNRKQTTKQSNIDYKEQKKCKWMAPCFHHQPIIDNQINELYNPMFQRVFPWPLGAQSHFMVLHHQETPAATRRMQHGGAIPIACLWHAMGCKGWLFGQILWRCLMNRQMFKNHNQIHELDKTPDMFMFYVWELQPASKLNKINGEHSRVRTVMWEKYRWQNRLLKLGFPGHCMVNFSACRKRVSCRNVEIFKGNIVRWNCVFLYIINMHGISLGSPLHKVPH